MAAGGRGWGLGGAGGTAAAGAPVCAVRGRFRDRGAGALCFVLARAPHAVGRGTVRCRGGEPPLGWRRARARAVAGGVRWDVRGACAGEVGATRPSAQPRRGLRCRVSEGRGGSGYPGRRKQGRWAYACRALTIGICNYVELIDPTFRGAGGVD